MASPLSILKDVINLKKIHVESTELVTRNIQRYGESFEQKHIVVHGRPIRRMQGLCPICGRRCAGYDHKSDHETLWRAPNLNGVPVYVAYCPRRIECPEHGVRTERIPWADGQSHFTEDFNNEVAWFVCQMTKTAISEYLMINWRTVGHCVEAAQKRLEPDTSDRMRGLRRICVDETSYRKGHSYITVVYDMDRSRVVWVSERHGQSVFEEFCLQLTEWERSRIEIVAGDGAKWIDACVQKHFPNATRCVDFFHVVEWAIEALDKVRINTASKAAAEYERRKAEFEEAERQAAHALAEAEKAKRDAEAELAAMPRRGRPSNRRKELLAFLTSLPSSSCHDIRSTGKAKGVILSPEQQSILDNLKEAAMLVKGAKHALGHNPENRTERQDAKIQLIENSYPDLYKAYQLKEALRLILHMDTPDAAAHELSAWIAEAKASGLHPMKNLAEKIERHSKNILNSVQFHVNSAKSESTNTTIKVLIKMARGFRNIGNMIALIYLKCSDTVVPLNNRIQMPAEEFARRRRAANERRKARIAERLQKKLSA